MNVLSQSIEAGTRLGGFVIGAVNGTLIVLSALLALATVAAVA